MHPMHATNLVLIGAWMAQIFKLKQNDIFLYINWQKGFIHVKLMTHDIMNGWKFTISKYHNKLHIMGVSSWTQWVFWKQYLLKLKSCKSLIELFLKWYYDAMQNFTHVTALIFRVSAVKVREYSIFKIVPSWTCLCYLYHTFLENRNSWYNVVYHFSLSSKLAWMSKRRGKFVTCHRSL